MSMEQITARIISDAESDARSIVETAEKRAAEILAAAAKDAEQGRRAAEADVAAKRNDILERKAASARLEGAKILLGEKRKVIETIYRLSLQQLQSLPQEDCLCLIKHLLEKYAEEDDEIFFADNFLYRDAVAQLPVVSAKRLKISSETLPLDGGLRLCGVKSDKDLSYGALLAADRDKNQANLAKELFK